MKKLCKFDHVRWIEEHNLCQDVLHLTLPVQVWLKAFSQWKTQLNIEHWQAFYPCELSQTHIIEDSIFAYHTLHSILLGH